MIALLLLAALQAAPGQPAKLLNPQDLARFGDYPQLSLRHNEYGIVSFTIHVSPEGKVSGCDVTESSGYAPLDLRTCALFKSRARFSPARDASGTPVVSEYRGATAWGVGTHLPTTTMDIPLNAPSLPADYKAPAKALVTFGASGRVATCEITATSGSDTADRSVCAYVTQRVTIDPPKSRGRAVPAGVRYITATLSAGPAS